MRRHCYPADGDREAVVWHTESQPTIRAFHLDPDAPAARISKESDRLFSQQECRLEVLSIGRSDQKTDRRGSRVIIEQSSKFTTSVNGALDEDIATRIFYIYQSYTWSPFQISQELFNNLISHLNVSPSLLDIIQLFGEKPGPVEESFTSYFDNLTLSPEKGPQVDRRCSYEIGYTVKYVERHGRTFPTDPFSIRETGIYHKWDSSTVEHNWIIFQASKTTKAGVERLCAQLPELRHFQVHAAILLAASEQWRYYTNYLEKGFSKLIDRSFFTTVNGPIKDGDLNVDFSDIKNLQILTDKLHQISHLLILNMNVGAQVQSFVKRVKSAWLPLDFSVIWLFDECDAKIEEFLFSHRNHKGRIDSMIARSKGIFGLIRTTLDFRAVNLSSDINLKNKEINENVHDITMQGVLENSYMKRMVYQSTRDTRSMKIIALITAIFLPATLVATVFGSNFFGFEDNGGSAKLRVASNFWIYVVATASLLCVTISAWWWCLRVSRSRDNDEESNDGRNGTAEQSAVEESDCVTLPPRYSTNLQETRQVRDGRVS
ncbi:hypothetical protein MMC22_011076 [Lobaria immixta]|nr:hypothetical protein [Lobaria immixta]